MSSRTARATQQNPVSVAQAINHVLKKQKEKKKKKKRKKKLKILENNRCNIIVLKETKEGNREMV